ncbi:MAG: Calx-beta domain protein, partial [Verrucomicrobiales bacterium]|nr:Calx-beta domain protein [Verrucomicrobiales bacterium]
PTLSLTASSLNVQPNTAVTFIADATDPNGDALAYNWDFGDTSFGFNSATNSKTFSAAGQYVVRCDVSDMKGGVVSRYVVVTVGTPDTFTISGRVLDSEGIPVRGVRVHNGGTLPPYTPPPEPGMPATPPATGNATYRYSYTDSDGYYTIGNVPAGTFQVGAFVFGYITRPLGFYNPIVVSDANISDLDFIAQNLPVVTVTPGTNATENDTSNPGFLTISRSGDLSQELKVRFAINGRASMGVDYENLVEAYTTNVVKMTNGDVITTNSIPVLNQIGQVIIAPFESSTNLYIVPIDNGEYAGPRDVLFTLMLQTNDLRYSTLFTNVVSTNTIGTNVIVTTNTLLLTITNRVGIPGWELLPSGSDNTLTWFQVPPTYAISNGEASILIIEDEPAGKPSVTAIATDTIATEGSDDTATVVFMRSGGPLDTPLVVHYSVGGTASNGFDFQTLSGTITIPAWDEYVTLPVIAINDLFVEPTETVVITVLDDPAYEADASPASIQIIDDDLPQIYIYATDSVADHAGDNGTITIARSGDLSSDLLVNYLVSGTAVAGVDYAILSGSVIIPANQITANISINGLSNAPAGERIVTILISESPAYNIHNLNTASVTIQDALPSVTLTTTSATAAEGGGSGIFTVTRSGGTNNSLTVYFLVGGSAVEGSDYVAIGTNVVIPAGAFTATITVVPKEDKFNELRGASGQDNVIVQLVKASGYNLGNRTSGTVTITDNDTADLPSVGFMLAASSGREDSGAAIIWLRTTSNPETNKPVRIAYRITSGTAVPNINYTPFGTGYVEILHVDAPKPPDPLHSTEGGLDSIMIPLLNDGQAAGNKTFTVQLFNYVGLITNYTFVTNGSIISSNTIITPYPTNYYIGAYSSHTFTIVDVGQTVVSIAAVAPEAYEQGAVQGAFEITRTGGSFSNPLTVRLSISGSAANGSDYVRIPDTVIIPAGTNRIILPVIPIDDPQEESIETVMINLVDSPGMTLQGGGATVTINDNDGTIQFTRQTYEVNESGTNVVIGVVRSGNTNLTLTVEYRVINGTASNGLDYASATNGTLTFAPGVLERTFSINILNDSLVEGNETVSLVLTNPTGGVPLGGQRTATLVILDDDTMFQFHTNFFLVNENGTNAIVIVDRLGLLNATSTVSFATSDGTATDGQDFTGTNMTLVFGPGETNKLILVPIKDDVLFEGNETVLLSLSNPGTNTAIGSVSNSVLTIVDDECTVVFASTNFSVFEYAGVVSVEVRRVGGTVNPFSVRYFTTDGTANGTTTNNQDYVAQQGTLNFSGDSLVALTNGSGALVFQPGETNKFISITILDDVLGEGNENFFVTLTNLVPPANGVLPNSIVLGQVKSTTVTIVDNETAGNVDYEYSAGSGANGPVYALGLQQDGKVVFGGDFTTFNGFN